MSSRDNNSMIGMIYQIMPLIKLTVGLVNNVATTELIPYYGLMWERCDLFTTKKGHGSYSHNLIILLIYYLYYHYSLLSSPFAH